MERERKGETQRINCYKCKFFYVTWDQNFPRGCKIFGFKSRQIPSVLVWESSGKSCSAFEEKDPAK